MSKINIPPAALEAADYIIRNNTANATHPYGTQHLTRAAIEAALNAWPGMGVESYFAFYTHAPCDLQSVIVLPMQKEVSE